MEKDRSRIHGKERRRVNCFASAKGEWRSTEWQTRVTNYCKYEYAERDRESERVIGICRVRQNESEKGRVRGGERESERERDPEFRIVDNK